MTFDNGSVNLLDPDTVEQLAALLERIEKDPDLIVVVFRSEKPNETEPSCEATTHRLKIKLKARFGNR